MTQPNCAIVIPVYIPQLGALEEVSLKQCARLFDAYPIILTGPEQLELHAYREILPQATWEPFPAERFRSIDSYNRLLLEPEFYQRFSDFQHILMHQTDAFVFRDDLAQWCASDYDYVGAPFPNPELTDLHSVESWTGRNGGLSLRRVSMFLDVLTRYRGSRRKSPGELLAQYHSEYNRYSYRKIKTFYQQHMGHQNTLGNTVDHYDLYEDVFWSLEATRTNRFRIPDPITAARFSLETEPRFWNEHLAGELPAGCHAWWRYDLEFWKPHIEKCGHQLPEISIER